MTTFNPENKETLTFGEALDPAMTITEQQDADQYLEAYIKYQEKFLKNGLNEKGKTAEQVCKENIGYWTGYFSPETALRVKRLFKCEHPVFG